MRKGTFRLGWVILSGCCVGCTILTSETFDEVRKSDQGPRGVYYVLPKGVVDLTLSVLPSNGEFSLVVGKAHYIPDDRHRYFVSYRPNPAYDDDVKVTTDQSGLLSQIDSTTEDKTPTAIVRLAEAVSALEAETVAVTAAEASEPLLNLTFDPLSDEELTIAARAVTDRIGRFINSQLRSCGYYADNSQSPASSSLIFLKEKRDTLQTRKKILAAQKTTKDTEADNAAKEAKQSVKDLDCRRLLATRPGPAGTATAELAAVCRATKALAEVDDELAKVTANLTDTEGAIKDITDAQKAEAPRCAIYEALRQKPPKARMRMVDHEGRPPPMYATRAGWVTQVHGRDRKAGLADCGVGICYRAREIFKIIYSIGGGDETTVLELPNIAPIIEVDIRRAMFVKKIQKMTFSDGFLTVLEVNKPSELAAFAKIPVDVGDAILTGLQARVKITNAQKDLAKNEAQLLQAESTLAETRAQYESAVVGTKSRLEASPERSVRRPASPGATSRPVNP